MTLKEMILNNPNRSCAIPASIFLVKHDGKEVLMCFASLSYIGEFVEMFDVHPDILTWEVTKEHFTRQELDEWKEQHPEVIEA